jgi:hypothetical protein
VVTGAALAEGVARDAMTVLVSEVNQEAEKTARAFATQA